MKTVSSKVPVTINEAILIVVKQIKDNITLIEMGKQPVPLNFEGPPGIGKTRIFKHISENYTFSVKNGDDTQDLPVIFKIINVSGFSDESDVVGNPVVTTVWNLKWYDDKDKLSKYRKLIAHNEGYDLTNVNDLVIVNDLIDELQVTQSLIARTKPEFSYLYKTSGVIRTNYAVPGWLPSDSINIENSKSLFILVLDDFTRCNEEVRNAIMPLVLEREVVSFKMNKYSMLFMTSNPNDGLNHVVDMDTAHLSRYLTYLVSFSMTSWENWAATDSSFSTLLFMFLKDTPELLIHESEDTILNPRVWERQNDHCFTELNALSSISDINSVEYSKAKTALISKLSKSINTTVSSAMSVYLNNNAVYIPSMELLMNTWTDDQVTEWMVNNIGISRQTKNVGLSLVMTVKISTYLKEIYLREGKGFLTKPFERFVRMYWDKSTQPSKVNGESRRHLNYIDGTHSIVLAKRVQSFLELTKDEVGDPISSGSKKYKTLEAFTMTDEVSKQLTNSTHDELFEDLFI